MSEKSRLLLALLEGRPAAFQHELRALSDLSDEEIESTLPECPVVVCRYASPDPHLGRTFTVVAAAVDGDTAEARRRAETYWATWLRHYLANHRC